jgi:hypothetical protein
LLLVVVQRFFCDRSVLYGTLQYITIVVVTREVAQISVFFLSKKRRTEDKNAFK